MNQGSSNGPANLTSYCLKNRFYKNQLDRYGSSQKEKVTTHLCMMGRYGGILHVPDDQYNKFLELYADGVMAGESSYFSEQRTLVFPMIFDYDIMRKTKVNIKFITNLVQLAQIEMKKYYKPDPTPTNQNPWTSDRWLAIICIASTKKIEEDKIKTGVHVYFPNLLVDQEQALQMRYSILCSVEKLEDDLVKERKSEVDKRFSGTSLNYDQLKEHWSYQSSGNSWEEIIDHQIYTTNGLRMPYSNRALSCHVCKKERPADRKSCWKCLGHGKIDEDRPYKPHIVLDEHGTRQTSLENQLKRNFHWSVKMCSIRRPMGTLVTPGYEIYEGAPKYVPETTTKRKIKSTNSTQATQSTKRKLSEVELSDVRFQTVMNIINQRTIPQYTDLVGKNMEKNVNANKYLVKVRGHGDRYCMNKRDYHNGSHIWFEVSTKGICQRCFCRKPALAQMQPCAKFESKPFPYTKDEYDILFGSSVGGMRDLIQTQFYRNTPEGYKKSVEDFLQLRIKQLESRQIHEGKPVADNNQKPQPTRKRKRVGKSENSQKKKKSE
jgi:hypothetical protein